MVMRMYYLNIKDDTRGVKDAPDELDTYYDLIGTDLIDIVYRRIGKHKYCITCDDCGMLRTDPKISAIDYTCKPQLVGNLVITADAGDGTMRDLTDAEIKEIEKSFVKIYTVDRAWGYHVLMIGGAT